MTNWKKFSRVFFLFALLTSLLAGISAPVLGNQSASAAPMAANLRDVIINEVAWGGTSATTTTDEWIELYNPSSSAINLSGWTLTTVDLTPNITLTGTIPAGGYYLLEKDDDFTVSDILADQIYTGTLNNPGETLTLTDNLLNIIDTANISGGAWDAGHTVSGPPYSSMERIGVMADSASAWVANDGVTRNGSDANGNPINGTPHTSKIDLSLTKTVNNPTPNVGDTVTFTITVSNINNVGYGTATNVVVKDLLPSGLTHQSNTPSVGTYDPITTGLWTVGTLSVGSSATLTINAIVAPSGLRVNSAEVWSSDQIDADSTPGNGSTTEDDYGTVTVTPPVTTGLSITNIVNNPAPNVGSNVVFTVTVSNFSASNATRVQVNTTFPAGLVFVSSSPATASGNLNIGALNSGASVTFIVTAKVTLGGTQNLPAVVSSNEFANATATETVTPVAGTQADLSLSQTWARSTTAAGRVNLLITVKNDEAVNSGNSATNVQVRDLLPSGLTYFSHTGGAYNNSTGIWAVGTILPGAQPTLTIVANVSKSGNSTTNFAEVWQSDQFDTDSTPGNGEQVPPENDESSVEVTVSDLSLTETVDYSGANAVFTVTVRNSGPDDAKTILIKNSKLATAANYTYVSHSSTAGTTYIPTPGLPTSGDWTIPLLLDGQSATLTVTTTIVSPAVNWAQVSDVIQVDPDSRPANCNNSVSSCIEDDDASAPSANLSITQLVDNPNPDVGENVVFKITVSNAGVAGTTNVQVKDTLPSGLTYVKNDLGATYSNGAIFWTVGTLANGASQTLTITAKVAANGIYTNWAEVWKSDEADPNSTPGNGSITEDDDDSKTITSYRSIVINEVAWSGTAASSEDEWIELYNPSNASINITGWTLRSASGNLNIPLSGTISAGGYFLLERDTNSTVSDVSADQIYTATTVPTVLSNKLSDDGEMLILCAGIPTSGTCGGTYFIDTANSDGSSSATNPWPKGSLASDYGSMERQGTSAETDKTWATNIGYPKNGLNANNGDIYGTPKKANSDGIKPRNPPVVVPTAVVFASRIVINEFLPRPGFDWNQDGQVDVFDEFIEIKNIGNATGTISGWQLDDAANGGSNPYTLPSVTLKIGERMVFYGSQTNILLSDGGDTVRLLYNGKVYDAYTYSFAEFEDQSICRMPDGFGSWYEDCVPTPNLTNTRQGASPSMPNSGGGYVSPVCDLPDTLPTDFLYAECNGYGADIWHSYYWDQSGWYDGQNIPSNMSKWESFVQ